MASKLVGIPQLALTKEESEELGNAITRVTEFYEVSIGNEEQRAWFNLAMVAGGLYMPKIFGGKVPYIPAPVSNEPTRMPSFMQG